MPKAHDFEFSTGETWLWRFELRDGDNQPLDITGGSVEWRIAGLTGGSPSMVASTGNGMITVTAATVGEGTVSIAAAQHAVIVAGEYTQELRATLADTTQSVQINGRLTAATSLF